MSQLKAALTDYEAAYVLDMSCHAMQGRQYILQVLEEAVLRSNFCYS
jgi:hypothetical protein